MGDIRRSATRSCPAQPFPLLVPLHTREWKFYIWPTITLLLAINQLSHFDVSAVHLSYPPRRHSQLCRLFGRRKTQGNMPTRHGVILTYNRGPFVVVTAYIMMVAMCLCVLTRLAAKFMATRTFKIDDYLITIAAVRSCSRAYFGILFVDTQFKAYTMSDEGLCDNSNYRRSLRCQKWVGQTQK